jgi:hypothetical protein
MTGAAVRGLNGRCLGTLVGGLLWSVAVAATAASLTTEADGIRVEVKSEPETPVTARKTTYAVRLVGSTGAPVTDARVTLTGRMADGMTAAAPLRAAGDGTYRGEVLFTMAGPWDLAIRIVREGHRFEIPLREQVAR